MVMLVQPVGIVWRCSMGVEKTNPLRRKRAMSFKLCSIIEPLVLWLVVVGCVVLQSNENFCSIFNFFCSIYHIY